ncbi:hypothetical protein EJ357_31115 [Streptomyces cyaneochromogenes]|uniref:Uncharacterized protein n=1 Tax=Streptomyces cyaneochromogenes TaxID=2496836 RepID=A0A3S9MDT6_9ACTN|nr:hypothetical protein [Streptomyces cyaneochromogenes]AZQ37352.1 hypothetical protein EJ357_31115 [Streptomyces cyaneochromogenes]
MPHPSIRPDVVVLLTNAAPSRYGTVHHKHRDGTPFTAAELELISTATQAERNAAAAQTRLESDWVGELPALQKALDAMITKYIDQVPGTKFSISEICDVMTDADQAEFKRLVEAIKVRKLFRRYPERGRD